MTMYLRNSNGDRCADECKGAQHKQTHLRQCSVAQVGYQTLLELSGDRGLRFVRELVGRVPPFTLLTMTEFV